MKFYLPILLTIISLLKGNSQNAPFQIYLEPMNIEELQGIQSYAHATHAGVWLIIGGRVDGLHRRQPWASFDPEGRNTQLTVIDPKEKKFWTAPLTSLSVALQDQLSSTNMEFYQDGEFLYLIGGYGHSQTTGSKLTYAMFTAANVPAIIEAVQNGYSLAPHFRTLTDVRFAVTGGHLDKIYDTYFLVGGQKFDGNYNPMNHATFTQEYTNSVRKFQIEDSGTSLEITHLTEIRDTSAFHRRDFNVVPQILSDGQEGLTAFSGVFQPDADLPFLNCVIVDSNSYKIDPHFAQYYNHYHCANLPLFSASANEMHTVFFGGISQYYVENNILIQDNDVPFVRTIARVTRDQNGNMSEHKMSIEMPSYLGASAEFIPLQDVPAYENGVLKLDELNSDSTLVGYIFGGIESSGANIFFTNEGNESAAHHLIYKVYLLKNNTTATDAINPQSRNGLQMQIHPNPSEGLISIQFILEQKGIILLTLSDVNGKILLKEDLSNQISQGYNKIEKRFKHLKTGGTYFVTLSTPTTVATQKMLVKT